MIISKYRYFLYKLYGRNIMGIMNEGIKCEVEKYNKINQSDIVHPCVRFSANKFKGHHWWLIYTPYYEANPDVENPILCYGVANDDKPPTNWVFYCEVNGKPEYGYNSDPTMFFREEELNTFWRENHTTRTHSDGFERATYGCIISQKDSHYYKNPILYEKSSFEDKEVSPAIIKSESGYTAYAIHFRFRNPKLHFKNNVLEIISNKLLWIFSLLEIFSEKRSYGVSIWKSKAIDEKFNYVKTTKIKNLNKLYKPWHIDVFEHDGKLYSVIQTNQCNADICLAVSEDNETFTMYNKPLITNQNINKLGIYKPTAFVHKDIFYLYYTAQNKNNRALNKMYLTKMPFTEVISKLQ